jgi:hypothetical protein
MPPIIAIRRQARSHQSVLSRCAACATRCCIDRPYGRIRLPIREYHVVTKRRRPCLHRDKMAKRSNGLLNRPSVNNLKRMNNLSHRLCVAPMMDRSDSFSVSIGCEAACAVRVHEVSSLYYAEVFRCADLGRSDATDGLRRILRIVCGEHGTLNEFDKNVYHHNMKLLNSVGIFAPQSANLNIGRPRQH